MGTIVSYQRYFWKRTGHSLQFAATIPTDKRLCQCQEELQERGTLTCMAFMKWAGLEQLDAYLTRTHEMGGAGTA